MQEELGEKRLAVQVAGSAIAPPLLAALSQVYYNPSCGWKYGDLDHAGGP